MAPSEQLERGRVEVVRTPAGEWWWRCSSCGAESRYVYDEKGHAVRLSKEHSYHCRGRKPLKGRR